MFDIRGRRAAVAGCLWLVLALANPIAEARADGAAQMLGPGMGIALPTLDPPPCGGDLLLSYDESAENAYAWGFGGTAPPYYGAFAESGVGPGWVCGLQLHLTTQPGSFDGQTCDCYVFELDGANPGAVLSVRVGVAIDQPATWPEVSTHEIEVPETAVDSGFFVGYWPDWPGGATGWWIAADLNGPGGGPRTNVAPGIGYPSGWQDASVVWGPTQALGIGAWLTGDPVPVRELSWGRVKSLY